MLLSHLALRRCAPAAKIRRAFSASADLSACLKTEREQELEVRSDVPEQLQEMATQLPFDLVDVPGARTFELVRTFGEDEKVTVSVDVADIITDGFDHESMLDLVNQKDEEAGFVEPSSVVEGEDDDDREEINSVNFTVSCTKSEGPKLIFQCLTDDDGVHIEGVHVEKALEGAKQYEGPLFEDLPSNVQEGFQAYLDERDVNRDLSVFLALYADVKEQGLYLEWMEDVVAYMGR